MGTARKAFLAFFAALLAVLALAPQANAQAINNPPALPHEVVVFPQRDFAVAEGYNEGENLTFRVLRDGVLIGRASGTVGADGILEVNHPGGVCWGALDPTNPESRLVTPDILPGDVVEVTGAGAGDATTTANVTAEAAFINDQTGNIEVHGTAKDANGGRLPIELLEQRIINPDLGDTSVGRRDIRATSNGAELGTIAYDDGPNGTGTQWTATYSDLGDEAERIAVAGQTRIMSWQATNDAGDRLGMTIFEEDEVGGPGLGGCGAGATNAITDFGRDAINADNIGQDLNVTGSSYNASAVSVSLTDGTNTVQGQITQGPSPAADADNPVSQTWKATFTEAQVRTLSDGMLTASTSYTVQAMDEAAGTPVQRTLKGADRQIEKDLIRPGSPSATPGGGQFDTWQNVRLARPQGEPQTSKIHYTTNGNQPTLASREFGENILVTDDQTIRAITVDRAGNTSQTPASFNYNIEIGQNSVVDPPANVTPVDFTEPAPAGINNPPQLPHEPVVFPERDFVSAEGYDPFQDLFVKVIRNGHVVGTAQGTTDATGFFEINHPGGVCWNGQTPDIMPGDRVVVADAQGNGDANDTMNITAGEATIEGDTVVVHGTAQDANGGQIPLDLLEQRIIQPGFVDDPGGVDRRDIRADQNGGRVNGGTGTLTYDDPNGTAWTAVYRGLDADDRRLALEGQVRILGWHETSPAGDRLGITIYEFEEFGGPGFGGCPAPAQFAVTGANNDAVNATNVAGGLEIHGLSSNASAVKVTLTDESGATATLDSAVDPNAVGITALPNSGAGEQVWKASFSAGQVGGLADGTLTASATYTVPGEPDVNNQPTATTFDGAVNFEVLKDTDVPAAANITATPQGGTYPSWQAITLEHNDAAGTVVRFTLDGDDPTPYSRLADSQVVLDSSRSLKAIAIDEAGNRSAVRAFDYQIVDGIPPRQPGAPDLDGASDTGVSNTDNLTGDATATFSGTAEAGSTVKVFSGSTQVGSGTASAAGGYSIETNLTTEGPQDITVTATDAAGNVSGASAPLNVNLDTSAPAAPTANPAAGSYLAAQQVSLSANDGRIFYTTNGSEPTTSSTQFTANSAPISVGRSTLIRAIAIDDAGNKTAASFNYAINTLAPTITNTAPTSANVRDRTPVIRATVLDRDRALTLGDITLRVDGATINDNQITYNANTGALSYTPRRALAFGNVPVSLRVTDAPRPAVVSNWSFTIRR